MSIECKAAVLRETGARRPYATSLPLSVEYVRLAPPQPNEVLVKIAGGGLCHSDLSIINGNRPRPLPLLMGHEGSGEVLEVGSAVNDVKVGDPIVFQFSASCGRCRFCQEGRPQICSGMRESRAAGDLLTGGSRITDMNGQRVSHHSGVSCFAEFAVVDRGSVVVIDRSMPLPDAALFGCAVMTGVGAVVNTARIRPGDTIAVIGLGGVGLNGVMGARLAGAEKIIALDIDSAKLEVAKRLGATDGVNAGDVDCVDQVLALTGGGVDYAIELAGSIAAMETAFAITGFGGSVVTAGLPPKDSKFAFDQNTLVAQEKSVRGSYMGSCVPVRDIPRFIDLYQQGRLPVDQLIDGSIGFDQINAGFDKLQDGQALRQILAPHG